MATEVRLLNDAGLVEYRSFLEHLQADQTLAAPIAILSDPAYSEPAPFTALVEAGSNGKGFTSAYELGVYLGQHLGVADKSEISHNHRLWNWLSLFFFDTLCPAINGVRVPAEVPAYFLAKDYSHQRYYRHIIRSAWHLVTVHGEKSKVLLSPGSNHPVPVSVRAEPQMQIGATQQFVESKTVVALAYALYFDESTGKLKYGASTKEDGGPRRLVAVLNQFDLTYDLENPSVETLLNLLPHEFDRFRGKPKAKKKVTS